MTIDLEAARAERMRLLRWLSKRQSAKVRRLEQCIADLLAAAERIQQSLDDHAPGSWHQKDRQMLARAIAKAKGASDDD